MIKRTVYNSNDLLEKLGEKYSLQKITHIVSYSDDYDDNTTKTKEDYFITTIPNIKKIYSSYWCFGSDRRIFLDDETELHLSSAKYEGRNDVLSLRENNILSNNLTVKGKFIEVDDYLDEWLKLNGINSKELKTLRIEVLQEETYEYPFYDIIFDPETGEITGENYKKKLKIKEKELAKAISDIEDKKTAYKIQYILENVNNLRIKLED